MLFKKLTQPATELIVPALLPNGDLTRLKDLLIEGSLAICRAVMHRLIRDLFHLAVRFDQQADDLVIGIQAITAHLAGYDGLYSISGLNFDSRIEDRQIYRQPTVLVIENIDYGRAWSGFQM